MILPHSLSSAYQGHTISTPACSIKFVSNGFSAIPALSTSPVPHSRINPISVDTGGGGGQGSVVAGAVAGTLAGVLVILVAIAIVCLTVAVCHHQALRKKQRTTEREVDDRDVQTNPAYATTAFSQAMKTNPNSANTTTVFNQDVKTDRNPAYISTATSFTGPDHQCCDTPANPRQPVVMDSPLYAEPDLTSITLDLTSSEDYI